MMASSMANFLTIPKIQAKCETYLEYRKRLANKQNLWNAWHER